MGITPPVITFTTGIVNKNIINAIFAILKPVTFAAIHLKRSAVIFPALYRLYNSQMIIEISLST